MRGVLIVVGLVALACGETEAETGAARPDGAGSPSAGSAGVSVGGQPVAVSGAPGAGNGGSAAPAAGTAGSAGNPGSGAATSDGPGDAGSAGEVAAAGSSGTVATGGTSGAVVGTGGASGSTGGAMLGGSGGSSGEAGSAGAPVPCVCDSGPCCDGCQLLGPETVCFDGSWEICVPYPPREFCAIGSSVLSVHRVTWCSGVSQHCGTLYHLSEEDWACCGIEIGCTQTSGDPDEMGANWTGPMPTAECDPS